MNERDMWEHQVDILSKRTAILNQQIEGLEQRLSYFENVIITLITALKDGGIIQTDPEGDHSFEE